MTKIIMKIIDGYSSLSISHSQFGIFKHAASIGVKNRNLCSYCFVTKFFKVSMFNQNPITIQ